MKKTLSILFLVLIINCEEIKVTNVSENQTKQIEYPCLSDASNCLASINIKGGSFNFYSSFNLDSSNNISGVIVVLHGATRNGDDYFNRMVSVLKDLGLENEIMVLSPQFITLYEKLNEKDWYWNTTSWKWGNQSYMNNDQVSISSFEVVDSLLLKMIESDNFLNLSKVLVTGHSSGSAFTHTFASTKTRNNFKNLSIDFAVVNSQYFLYPDSNRILNEALYLPTDCNNYNDWPLGLTNCNPYIENLGWGIASSNLIENKVDYFIGSNDTQTSDMSSGCAYDILGEHRYEKTIKFNNYLDISFSDNQHKYIIVEGVGHSSIGMFSSEQFKNYLNVLF